MPVNFVECLYHYNDTANDLDDQKLCKIVAELNENY